MIFAPMCEVQRFACIAVGEFSCELNNPCTQELIETYGYYFPHYDETKYVQCDIWDQEAGFSQCREFTCLNGMVWDQINGYCNYPDLVGSSNRSFFAV